LVDLDVYLSVVVTAVVWEDIREMRAMFGKVVGEMGSVDVRKLDVNVSG
jgi:hypothetical protein